MKVGLALSGGGARGFAHVGVVKVLIENGVTIDAIAGTSAGSIVGGALAAGMSVGEIETMARSIGWLDILRPSMSPRALFSNAPLGTFLSRTLPVTRFDEMNIPFAAVGYDLTAGREVVYRDEGDAVFAICASCAVPGVFMPVADPEGHLIVDGGVTNVLPVSVAKDLGADVVIAVDLLSSGEGFRNGPRTAAAVAIRSAMAMLRQAADIQSANADIVITPKIAHIRPDQMNKREELMRLGEEAGRASIDEILRLVS